jgi:osmotically-inducible protein OsmY
MRITTTTAFALLLALGACDKNDKAAERGADESMKVTTESAKPAEEGARAADNTQRNERDRELDALTPGDQAENESDRAITQRIRQGVMEQDKLSTNAKNVKIITRDGVVTLRGPVDSAEEKTLIAQIAQKASGVKNVENQLETKSP